jgi:hypothetical protein
MVPVVVIIIITIISTITIIIINIIFTITIIITIITRPYWSSIVPVRGGGDEGGGSEGGYGHDFSPPGHTCRPWCLWGL